MSDPGIAEREDSADRGHEVKRQLLRVALTLTSFGVLWITWARMDRWLLLAKANFDYGLPGWLPTWAGTTLAGLIFGLACWLPHRLRSRPMTAIALGFLPLFGLLYPYAYFHFRAVPPVQFLGLDSMLFFGFALGVGIASGFGDGARRLEE